MAKERSLRRGTGEPKHRVKPAVEETRVQSEGSGRKRVRNVNVAGRANVVVAKNLGEDSGSAEASEQQTVRIRQDGDETYEEVETTRVTR